jgi:hypothetical protein
MTDHQKLLLLLACALPWMRGNRDALWEAAEMLCEAAYEAHAESIQIEFDMRVPNRSAKRRLWVAAELVQTAVALQTVDQHSAAALLLYRASELVESCIKKKR